MQWVSTHAQASHNISNTCKRLCRWYQIVCNVFTLMYMKTSCQNHQSSCAVGMRECIDMIKQYLKQFKSGWYNELNCCTLPLQMGSDNSANCKGHKRLFMILQPPPIECTSKIGDGRRTQLQWSPQTSCSDMIGLS